MASRSFQGALARRVGLRWARVGAWFGLGRPDLRYGHLLLACGVTPVLLFPSQFPLLTVGALGAWLGWWLWLRAFHPDAIRATPLDMPLLLLLALVPPGFFMVVDDGPALLGLSRLALGIVWYYALTQGITSPATLRGPLLMLTGLAALFCGAGVLATAWQIEKFPLLAPLYRLLPSVRLSGPLAGANGEAGLFHPNMIAGTLVMLAPLVAGSVPFWGVRGWLGRLAGAVALASVVVIGLTQSRFGWATTLLVAGLLPALLLRWRGRWLAWAGTAAGALLLVATRDWWTDAILGSRAAGSWRSRQEVWERALWGLSDFPLTGLGLGQFEPHTRAFYPYIISPDEWHFGHAHNLWLQVGVEFGWVGILAWAIVLGATLWRLASTWRALPAGHWARSLILGLLGSLAAYGIFGLIDAVPWGTKPGFLVWMVVGLAWAVAGLAQRFPRFPAVLVAERDGAGPAFNKAVSLRWLPWLMPLLCLATVPLALWLFPSNMALHAIRLAPPAAEAPPLREEGWLLASWARGPGGPEGTSAAAQLGAWYQGEAQPLRALFWYGQAVREHPEQSRLWQRQGESLAALGRGNEAAAAYREALRRDPGNIEATLRLAELALRQGDEAGAVATLRAGVAATDQRDATFYTAQGRLRSALREWAMARDAFHQANALRPTREGLVWEGLAALEAGDPAGALGPLGRARRLNPFESWTAYHLGRAHEGVGDLGRAERLLREALALEGRDEFRIALGRVLLVKGSPAAALPLLRAASQGRPYDPEAWRWLARTERALGGAAEARVAYQQLIQLLPHDPEAQQALDEGDE